MNNEIHFPLNITESYLRNGYTKTKGIAFEKAIAPDYRMNKAVDTVEIYAVNSRGNLSSGFIRVPQEASVLRAMAASLTKLADEVDGKDMAAKIQSYVEITERAPDQEAVTEALDDLIHDVEPNSHKASWINNQGRQDQVEYLVLNGYGVALVERVDALPG